MTALTELKKELHDIEERIAEAKDVVEVARQDLVHAQGQLVDARQDLADREGLRSQYRDAIAALEREADRG